MRTRSRNPFSTVKTAGLLLPVDLLTRIVEGDGGLSGLSPDDYHLPPGERLNEAASQAWNRCLAAWRHFRREADKLPATDTGTTLTRQRWLLPLFQELGYGRLQATAGIQIEGKAYPVSHAWGEHVPIHLVSFRHETDKRTPGVAGAATRSPYSMVQELLNRSAAHRWGFLSNGRKLIVLRDNAALVRAANVEFDLEAMMEGEVYADFTLLFLICHQSRVEIPPDAGPEDCWLEKWSNLADEQGTRAREHLRDGVEAAINALGAGFLTTKGNTQLRDRLRSGDLSTQDYYRQLLRLVYRLLMLLVAEEKKDEHGNNLLHPPDTLSEVRERYARFYSVSRVRQLAAHRRGTPHADLYESLKVLFLKFREGYAALGIPGLGSFLFSAEATPDLDHAALANVGLLESMRKLTFTLDTSGRGGAVRRPVDFANLGSEELGSVYESLLELHPRIDSDEGPFTLTTAAGHERKTTGSYYTPTSLINCLLDSALDPVAEEALAKPNLEQALLDLKICDPACGSGHFLIAAAERLAKHLARLRTGDEEPSVLDVQHAKREIIGRCIYGVDINPMAVELCKVSLWMEALEPGRPLSFLDAHIQCGNSLLGATPRLLRDGIPDDAFKPIEGDDKKLCAEYKKQNRDERRGQKLLPFEGPGKPWERMGDLATALANLDDEGDDTVDAVRRKQERYAQLVSSAGYLSTRFWADAWCAAFVWKKTKEFDYAITEEVFRRIERNPHDCPPWMRDEVQRLARQFKLFHWHLAFPQVFRVSTVDEAPDNDQTGWSGGFDVVLGNPPWERVQFEERAFFADKKPEIHEERNQSRRRKMIAGLRESDPALFKLWEDTSRHIEGEAHLMRSSGRFPLSAVDKFNLYAVFLELGSQVYGDTGSVGLIVKAGYISDSLCADLFANTMREKQLVAVAEFENRRKLFPAVDSRERFALVTLGHNAAVADFCFDNLAVGDLAVCDRHIRMSYEDILRLSPNTKNCPKFSDARQFRVTRRCYDRFQPLHTLKPDENPWGVSIDRYINVSDFSDSILLATEFDDAGPLGFAVSRPKAPLYEGKLFYQFDHRYASYSVSGNDVSCAEVSDKTPERRVAFYRFIPTEIATRRNPRLGTGASVLVARDITNRTNERGVIAAIVPENITDYTVRVIQLDETTGRRQLALLSILNSCVFDYLARQRIGGTHLSNYVLEQVPTPAPNDLPSSVWDFVVPRALELTYTGWDLEAFAADCGCSGPPFRWDDERRFLLRCELDAAFFHLYLGTPEEWQEGSPELLKEFPTPRAAIDYVMETFPIVKRKDMDTHGTYRTKDQILAIYDMMAEAIRTGRPYQTLLDPPPADPRVAHPPREPVEVRPVREVAAMATVDTAFPSSDRDKWLCAVMLDLVEVDPGRATAAYLDAMWLATHPDRCATLLTGSDQSSFRSVARALPRQLTEEAGATMPWRDLCDTLLGNRSLQDASTGRLTEIVVGENCQAVRAQFGSLPGSFVVGVAKAAERLRELQAGAVPADEQTAALLSEAQQWRDTVIQS